MPLPTRRRRRWVVPVFVAAAVLVYLLVVLLYANSGRFTSIGPPEIDRSVVTVVLTPDAVNAAGDRLVMQAEIEPPADMLEDESPILKQDLSVIIGPVEGQRTIDIEAGTIPPARSVSILADGEIEKWPFDSYHTQLVVVAYTTVNGEKKELLTDVFVVGGVPGWNLSGFINTNTGAGVITDEARGVTEPIPVVDMTATRSGSTLAFGVLLLGLMVVMPVLVLFVAITAFRGIRKVEATLMSWMGAMLFATIPLRTFLPGSPPIGSWIDFLIVLWVIVGLITGLTIYVAAWMRWGTPATPRTPPDPPAPPPSA
jgi:hypothetical protein